MSQAEDNHRHDDEWLFTDLYMGKRRHYIVAKA